ncbi:hypothetical protein GCM10027418_26600 [Mariniluteicoccus endophyticus]
MERHLEAIRRDGRTEVVAGRLRSGLLFVASVFFSLPCVGLIVTIPEWRAVVFGLVGTLFGSAALLFGKRLVWPPRVVVDRDGIRFSCLGQPEQLLWSEIIAVWGVNFRHNSHTMVQPIPEAWQRLRAHRRTRAYLSGRGIRLPEARSASDPVALLQVVRAENEPQT